MVSEAGGSTGEQETAKPRSRRTLILSVGAGLLLLVAAAAGGWWMWATGSDEHAAAAPVDAESLVDVAPMTVNLRTPDGAAHNLRVHVMLVPGEAGKEVVEAQLPLIVDAFQPFLRELRPEDIAGSAATFRVKEELLIRSNAILGEGSVRDVLIQDLVQQ